MQSITADKHFAPQRRGKSFSVSRLRSSSRFIFPRAGGDIKLQQWQKQHPNTPLPAGLPSPLSAVSSKCLLPVKTRAFNQVCVCLHNYHHVLFFSFFPQKLQMGSHITSENQKSRCILQPVQQKYCWCIMSSFIFTLDWSLVSHHYFCPSLYCHKQYKFPKNAFWTSVLNCFYLILAEACVIFPQEQSDSSAFACLKAWHEFAPSLPLRLVETSGQSNEPP